uniref:formate--tetrahydrofolate ligase n=1 Tax=Clostridioides difficile TaxID=1496 RepID=A0A381I6S1_CLODI|nr:formate--tetrahydrofolate ligase [Clostridioides difficile]
MLTLEQKNSLDIKCRMANLKPDAVIIVATVRALKYNGGVAKADLNNENLEALEKGLPNLLKHVENILKYMDYQQLLQSTDSHLILKLNLNLLKTSVRKLGVNVALSEVWAKRWRRWNCSS